MSFFISHINSAKFYSRFPRMDRWEEKVLKLFNKFAICALLIPKILTCTLCFILDKAHLLIYKT